MTAPTHDGTEGGHEKHSRKGCCPSILQQGGAFRNMERSKTMTRNHRELLEEFETKHRESVKLYPSDIGAVLDLVKREPTERDYILDVVWTALRVGISFGYNTRKAEERKARALKAARAANQ